MKSRPSTVSGFLQLPSYFWQMKGRAWDSDKAGTCSIHGLAEIPNAHDNTCCQLDVSTVYIIYILWEYDQHTLDPDELALYVQSIMIHIDSPSPKS